MRSTCGMHHMSLRQGLRSFPPGLAEPSRATGVVFGEFDYRTCQQLERPAGTALWGAQGGRHQRGFFLARELRSASGRGSSLSARSRLHSAKLRSVRYTVEPPTLTLLAISSSPAPASAASKICARLSLRDACLPPLSSALSSVCSTWLSSDARNGADDEASRAMCAVFGTASPAERQRRSPPQAKRSAFLCADAAHEVVWAYR
jgi:hypothetical protein